MRKFIKKIKGDTKQKSTTAEPQQALTTIARSALRLAALGTPVLDGAPTTETSTKKNFLHNFKTALVVFKDFTDDINVPGLKGAVGVLLEVLDTLDVSRLVTWKWSKQRLTCLAT